MANLWESLGRMTRPFWLFAGALLVLLVGCIDYITGTEISFSIFYLFPVTLVTWFVSMRAGILIAVASALSWILADLLSGHLYSHHAIPYWNMSVRLGFFLIVLGTLSRLKAAYEREKELSGIDPLTGVTNGRAFREAALAEIERAQRYGRPFAIAYVDLDNFKTVNDRFGHSTGDTLLRTVANDLRKSVRATDSVARLGGDEFAILFPETGDEAARAVLEKLRHRVADSMRENEWPVTMSVGAATFFSPPDSVDSMVRLADELMYAAKKNGKNRIRHEVYGR